MDFIRIELLALALVAFAVHDGPGLVLANHIVELHHIVQMGTHDLLMRNVLANFALFLKESDILFNLHRVFFLDVSLFIRFEGDIVDLVEEILEGQLINGAENDGFGRVVKVVLTDKLIEAENRILGQLLELCVRLLYLYIDLV